MGKKYYSMWAKAVDNQGETHIVTIVGELSKYTRLNTVTEQVDVMVSPNKTTNGLAIFDKAEKVRELKYSYAICHPHDVEVFNEERGVELAKSRLNKPLGLLTTTFKTTLCDDQVRIILMGELKHIVDNIDHFIEKL